MKLRKAPILAAVAAVALPVSAAESPSAWPERDLAKFVFEHLDLTSFRNSTGPRRRPGQRFYKDLDVHPDQVSETEAASTLGDWLYSVIVLRTYDYSGDGRPEVLVCFSDIARNGGSYFTINSYVLLFVDGRAVALAYDDGRRAEEAGCRSARSRADADLQASAGELSSGRARINRQ
jgi:hypothetical protein